MTRSALEELDYQQTAIGELILRRRRFPMLGERDVFEVILNDEYLMSSLFTAGEIALAEIGLEACEANALDIIVGGLGLGYTAVAALEDRRVRSMTVVEALPAVISWHRHGLLPVSPSLTSDPRCRFHPDDFFDAVKSNFAGLAPGEEQQRFDAVLLDIDHSPGHVLHPHHRSFYSAAGIRGLAGCLHDGGVFALWSNDPPDAEFSTVLHTVFADSTSHVVTIDNPITGVDGHNTIYVCRK